MPEDDPLYMTDDLDSLRETTESRSELFPPDLEERWRNAKPDIRNGELLWQPRWPFCFREAITYILGHEVISNYQRHFMNRMAEVVTRSGGNILEVGYGRGDATRAIECWRQKRNLGEHVVIELNRHLAAEARTIPNVTVREGDWETLLLELDTKGRRFGGILYDGYPLKLEDLHRDGVPFIQEALRGELLAPGGLLVFFADTQNELGQPFCNYVLTQPGIVSVTSEAVQVTPPKRKRQTRIGNTLVMGIAQKS